MTYLYMADIGSLSVWKRDVGTSYTVLRAAEQWKEDDDVLWEHNTFHVRTPYIIKQY